LVDTHDTGYVMIRMNKHLKKSCNDGLIHRIEIGTYHRELERYGKKHIELSEKIFSIDSEYVLSLLSFLRNKDENLRWMAALMLIDRFLEDANFDGEEKYAYTNRLSESFKTEFGYTMYNAKQLNHIYRDRKKQVETALDKNKMRDNADLSALDALLMKKSDAMKIGIKDIPKTNISSYIHMSINRLFRSKNRIHELLLYDFLARYYKSELAKLKYSKSF
jgi:thiopeptide-type bacteriocin biosynthesis protein